MDKHPSLNAPLHQFEFYFHLKNIIEKNKTKNKNKNKQTNKEWETTYQVWSISPLCWLEICFHYPH